MNMRSRVIRLLLPTVMLFLGVTVLQARDGAANAQPSAEFLQDLANLRKATLGVVETHQHTGYRVVPIDEAGRPVRLVSPEARSEFGAHGRPFKTQESAMAAMRARAGTLQTRVAELTLLHNQPPAPAGPNDDARYRQMKAQMRAQDPGRQAMITEDLAAVRNAEVRLVRENEAYRVVVTDKAGKPIQFRSQDAVDLFADAPRQITNRNDALTFKRSYAQVLNGKVQQLAGMVPSTSGATGVRAPAGGNQRVLQPSQIRVPTSQTAPELVVNPPPTGSNVQIVSPGQGPTGSNVQIVSPGTGPTTVVVTDPHAPNGIRVVSGGNGTTVAAPAQTVVQPNSSTVTVRPPGTSVAEPVPVVVPPNGTTTVRAPGTTVVEPVPAVVPPNGTTTVRAPGTTVVEPAPAVVQPNGTTTVRAPGTTVVEPVPGAVVEPVPVRQGFFRYRPVPTGAVSAVAGTFAAALGTGIAASTVEQVRQGGLKAFNLRTAVRSVFTTESLKGTLGAVAGGAIFAAAVGNIPGVGGHIAKLGMAIVGSTIGAHVGTGTKVDVPRLLFTSAVSTAITLPGVYMGWKGMIPLSILANYVSNGLYDKFWPPKTPAPEPVATPSPAPVATIPHDPAPVLPLPQTPPAWMVRPNPNVTGQHPVGYRLDPITNTSYVQTPVQASRNGPPTARKGGIWNGPAPDPAFLDLQNTNR